MKPCEIRAALDGDGVLRVEVSIDGGASGIGEARLRTGITGETGSSAMAFVQRLRSDCRPDIHDVASLRRWIADHEQAIDCHPAAWSAVELAFLDALARRERVGLEALLGLRPARPLARGTACIGETTSQQFDGQLTYYICAGYVDYKVALTGSLQVDRGRIEALEAGRIPGNRMRAAAHGLWLDADQAIDYLSQLGFPGWAIEEPLAPGALREMRTLGERTNLRIVLDESLRRTDTLDLLAPDASRWVALTRIGKLGGLLRTLAFVQRARALGIDLILASHPDDPPGMQRAHLCLMAQAETALAHETGIDSRDFGGSGIAPGRPARADPPDVAGWLSRPGLGIEPMT